MAKKKFIPRPKESERVIRKRWTKKRDSIENLSNNVQKLRYNVSLGLKNESNNEKNFLTCLVIAIMDKSFERVGNEASAANGKVGITGLNKDQVTIIGNKIILEYTGKSGVEHEKMFSDAKIAKALKIAKKNSPDENVFTTSKGFKIRNNRINRYLSDFGILSKNLRGYGANNLLVKKLSELEPEETEAKRKVQFNKVARFVAKKVGHGLPTLKKHYMIPEIEPNFIEFSKVIEIDDVSKFNDGGTVKVEEKTKKTKPSENPNVDKFTCEDAIPDSKLKKSLPQEIEDILEKDNSSFKEGGGVVKPKIVVHNNTDSASDKDAQKIIINYLKNINESGHKKFFEFLKKSNQNINDYEAVFYLSKDYYDKNVGKYYSNKIIYQKNVSDAYQNALNYDDAYPNFIRIYKHGNIKGFAATTEFDLFGDWEGDKYDDNGRLKQELKEQAIQQLKKDLYVTNNQNSGEYKMKEGGDIKNLGNDILPIGSIISVQEFRSYHKYEVVGFVEKREGSGIRYDVYELKADMSGVKGKKTQITFPYPNTKTKFRYNATIPKEGSKLISQSEIDSEKRRGSESEVVIKWEGNKPSYLMTKEEYKSIVTPKMKEFNKFISKNKEYFSKKDYYGIDYLDFESFKSIHEPSQYSTVERDFLQRSKTSEGTVPKQADEKLIKELNEYKDYFANIFGRENIKKIEDDEVGNNKRSIRRAIDSGVYEKLLREGKINYTFLKTVFDSVGINIPTKLEKIESEVVDKGITSDVQISLKEKTENFFSNLKRLFEKEIRFYADTFKEHYIESIKRMKNFCDRHKEFVNYDTFAYNYSINNNYQPTPIYENVRGIQKLKGYNYHPDIQKLYFLNKIFENSSSNESVRFFIADNWEELLEVRALDYANDLFKNFGRRILQETEVINSIDKNFPEIQNARVLRLTEKGFEANFDLKYPNGFIFSVETQVIYAGGYNIQALHLRGLFKFQYKGKFISEKELIEAYNSFSGEEKTIEKGSLIINEISIPENIDVLLKEKYTLNKDSDFYSSELMKLAGESGLVSEEVRKSNEYIRLNVKSKISFKKLQEFNESEKNKTIDDFVRKLDRVTQQKIRSHYSEEITKFEKGGEFHEWTLVIKNNETGEKFTENAVGRDINEAINNYDAQHTSILETGKYEVVSHKKGNKTVAKYSEGGEVDDDKKEGGRYSFKNDFGSFTSVFVYVPIKDKKEFLVEVTVRRKNTDGNTELKVNSKWMPIEKYDSFIEDLKERQRLSEIDKKEDGGEFESCVLQIKAKMSEGGELTIDRKKVYEGDKKLRDMSLDDVEKYIGIYHEKDGNMFFAKNKFIIWFYDTTDFANKINSGEYDFLMFPNRMKGFSFNSVGIIDEVWRAKYQNKHKGAKNLLGMVQGWYDEVNNKIIIHFMSVRPSAKRNHINSFMVQYAKKVFESTDVIFHEPTAQGYSFIESEKFEEGGDLKENSKKHTYYIQERVKWGEKTWVIMERYPYLTGFAEEEYNGEIYTDENKAKSKLDLINLLNKDKHEEGGDLKNNFKVEVIYDLLAPNGKPSNLTPEQYKLVRSPEFIAWFGNWIEDPENSSKVVDSNGEPLVVFHVTDKDFFLFDNKKSKDGFYFSANKERLKAYNKKRILEVFLNIKNPSSDEFNKNGFDGIMDFGHSENKSANSLYEIVAFESNQIKLADGTNTTFDGSNPDTRFDMGGSIISKEIWNKWLKENTNERGIAEYESNDGTEFSFDYVNSIITISRKKYPKGLDMVIKKENYSTGELSKIFKAFDERVKELVFGNKSFKLSDNKQTLIEYENNPDISFENGGDIDSNDFDDYRDYDELSGTIVGEVLDEQYYRYLYVFPQTQRFILSEDEEIKFRDKTQNAEYTFKPRGLWYAFGMDWFDAVQSVVPSYASRYNFIHTIKVTDKVCSIKTIEEAVEFTDKYGFGEGHFYKQYLIDWSKVEKDYSGVEALDPIRWCRTEGFEGKLWWLYSWDAASGCIWKSDGIESIEPYDYKEVYKNKMKEWEDHEEMMNREYNERKKSSNHPMKKGGSMPSHYIKIVSKDGDYVGVMKFNPNNTRRVMSLADLASSSRKAGYKLIPIDSKKYDELVYNIDYEKLEKFQKDIDASDELGSDVHDLSFKKGGSLELEDKDSIYNDWKELINMSYRELKSFYDSKEGKEAGLSRDEADDLGIHSGRESAKWILKMKHTKRNDWTDSMWEWAKRQISFVKRMSASKGELYDDNGNKTRKHTSLLIWGHNPEKHKMTFGGYVGSVDSNGTEPFIDSEGIKRFKIDDFNAEIDENKVYEVIDVVNKTQETFTLKLTDFLYNWDGYKYYPNIKNTKVRFYYNALDKINAGQDKNTGDIIINCYKIVKDYEKYIKHITSSTRMDEKTSHSKGGNGKNITEREYVLRLFRRKLFHETQHLLQLFEGIEPISTNIKDVVIYVRKKYNVEHLSLDEFEKFITEKHNLPIVSYDAAIYKEYKDIPTEKECFYVEDEIQKEYNKLDN